jgi:hypothetical protein
MALLSGRETVQETEADSVLPAYPAAPSRIEAIYRAASG